MNKLLFFLGTALCVAGTVAGLVTDNWSLQPLGLIVTGIILLVLVFAFGGKRRKEFWHKRSTQVGTNALIATTAMILIIGLINFLAVGYSVRWDLTENQLFTLSPQSQTLVENLAKPLKVWVFDRSLDLETETLLENYRRYSNNFQYELVDPEIEVGLAEQFQVQTLGETYIEYGDKRQRIANNEPGIDSGLSEIQLTNAIKNIQRDRTANIYFLQGHGELSLDAPEGSMAQAVKSLQDQGYAVQPLNLATSANIPDNADIVAVAGAVRTLFPAEVEALQNYLNNGGRLLLLLAPQTDPGLTPLLQNWGIELDDRLVIDASGAGRVLGFGPAVPLITDYGNHPITKDFGNGISILPESRPLFISSIAGIEATPIVTTGKDTWAESNLTAEEIAFNSQEDKQGPLDIAVALSRIPSSSATETDQTKQPSQSRMIVFGSSTFAANGWFQQQLNSDLLLNSIDWLAGEEAQTLSIRPKEQTNRRLNLTPLQAGIISWTAILIMPLVGLIVAAIVWWRRR